MKEDVPMVGVTEYSEGYEVMLVETSGIYAPGKPDIEWERHGRLAIRALNEGGNNCTEIDLLDLLKWVKRNRPEIMSEALNDWLDMSLDESTDECKHPIDYSFTAVNNFVNSAGVNFEELQACCLGLATEADRLSQIIVQAHDRLLRGDSDKELLDLLETGWSEPPQVKAAGYDTNIDPGLAPKGTCFVRLG